MPGDVVFGRYSTVLKLIHTREWEGILQEFEMIHIEVGLCYIT